MPLIMHFPGRFEGGLTASAPVIGIDLAPTIARAVGLPPHPSWSGVALSPENTIADRPMWVPYRTRHTGQAAVALRRDNAKLLDFPGDERPNDGNSGRQLYDLAVDGEERINRWEDDSVEAARWDRALTNLRLRYPLRFQGETVSTDEDVAEMLKGLGYGGDD